MTEIETTMTGETVAALIAVPLLTLIFLVLGVLAFREWRWSNDGEFLAGGIFSALVVIGCVVGLWWGMYPWKAEYHEWRPVRGTVATVDSRLMSTDGGMYDKFVVTFTDGPQQFGVLDTRAASLRPGDYLTITCVRRWQWSGSHGYDCNFVDMTKGGNR